MKITKRQLRRIIREERDAILEGPGRRKYGKGRHYNAFGQKIYKSPAPKKSIDHRFVYEYEMWVEDFGQGAENPSHPGVMASYFLEKGLEDDHEKHEALGNLYGVDHEDIMRDINQQLSERSATMGESRMRITKRQLRRIIKEEKAKILKEENDRLISENIFQGALDKVSDFFTGDKTTRGIDPAKAEEQLMDAIAMFVGSRVQDEVNKGASTDDAKLQALFDKALDSIDAVVDKFAAEGGKIALGKN
jgi:hypothetical protein